MHPSKFHSMQKCVSDSWWIISVFKYSCAYKFGDTFSDSNVPFENAQAKLKYQAFSTLQIHVPWVSYLPKHIYVPQYMISIIFYVLILILIWRCTTTRHLTLILRFVQRLIWNITKGMLMNLGIHPYCLIIVGTLLKCHRIPQLSNKGTDVASVEMIPVKFLDLMTRKGKVSFVQNYGE